MKKAEGSKKQWRSIFSERRRTISMVCAVTALTLAASIGLSMLPGLRASAEGSILLTSNNGQNTIPATYVASNVPEGTPTMTAEKYKSNSVSFDEGVAAFDFHIFAEEFQSTVHTCGNVATNLLKGAPEFGSRSNHSLDVERVSYVKAFNAWATSTNLSDTAMVFGQGVTFHRNGQFYAKCGSADVSLGNDNSGSITGHIYIENSEPFIDVTSELQRAEDYMRYLVWLQKHSTNTDDGAVRVVTYPDSNVFKGSGSNGNYTIDLSRISEPTVIFDLTEAQAKGVFMNSVKITGTTGKRVIFNILDDGDGNVKLNDTNMTADNLNNSEDSANKDNNILWNFYNMQNSAPESVTGTVQVGGTWIGSINAPEATIECRAGLNGSIIGKTVRTYCETHKSDYTGERSKKKTIDIVIHKQWKGDVPSVRPDFITLELYQTSGSGTKLYRSEQVEAGDCTINSANNEWSYAFTGLPAADSSGNTYNYTVKEVPAAGYESLVFNKTIVNTYLGIVPEIEEYTLKLGKTDERGRALSGASLRLTAKDSSLDLSVIDVTGGTGVEKASGAITWTSDGSVVKFEHMPKGVYYVSEVAAPAGYKTAESKTINLMYDVTESIVNYPVTLDIGKYDGSSEGDLLPGATMKLTSTDGRSLANVEVSNCAGGSLKKNGSSVEWKTAGGKTVFTRIPAGSYELAELAAPNGYQLAAPVYFSIDASGKVTSGGQQVSEIRMTDNLVPKTYHYYDLTIAKKNGDGTGAAFVEGAAMELVAAQDFTEYGSACDPQVSGAKNDDFRVSGNKITWTTGTEAVTVTGLPEGDYTIIENGAPVGYAKAAPQSVTLDGNKSVTVVDEKLHVTISKKAVGGTDELPGADFVLELLEPDNAGEDLKGMEGADAQGKCIYWTSGDAPRAISSLPAGVYMLSELTAPNGYNTSEEIYCKVTADGKVFSIPASYISGARDFDSVNWGTEALADNTLVVYDSEKMIRVYKQIWDDKNDNGEVDDGEYSAAALVGAQLRIEYPAESGRAAEDFTTAAKAAEFGGIVDGVYVISETAAPDGFAPSHDIRFKLADGDIASCNIEDDVNGLRYDVEELGGEGLNEDPCTSINFSDDGSIEVFMVDKKQKLYTLGIKKCLDSDHNVLVPGARMAVFKRNSETSKDTYTYYSEHVNEALAVFVTEAGKNWSKKFPTGKYAIIELEAPRGYELSTSVLKIGLPYDYGNGRLDGGTWSFENKKLPDPYKYFMCIQKQDADNYYELATEGSMTVKVYDSRGAEIHAVLIDEAYPGDTVPEGETVFGYEVEYLPRSVYEYVPEEELEETLAAGRTVVSEFTSYGGEIEIRGLAKEEYFVKEVTAPEGFMLNTEPQKALERYLATTFDQCVAVTIEDHHISGSLSVLKKDENGTPRDGALFQLYAAQTADGEGYPYAPAYSTGQIRTTKGGMGTYEYLPLGYYYYYEEIEAPEGCKLPEDPADRFTERVFLNDDPSKGDVLTDALVIAEDENTRLTIAKVDENGEPLSGARLRLEPAYNTTDPEHPASYTYGDAISDIVLTDTITGIPSEHCFEQIVYEDESTGRSIVMGFEYEYRTWISGDSANELTRLPAGTYCLSETEAPLGYEIAEPIYFTVNATGDVFDAAGEPVDGNLITMTDEKSTGSITLTKRDDQLNYIRIEGAQFKLLRSSGSGWDEVTVDSANVFTGVSADNGAVFTTNENGQIAVTGLPYGYEYRFVETAAAPGYGMADDSFVDAELTAEDLDMNLTLYNDRAADKKLTIKKIDGEDAPIKGAVFSVYRRAEGTDDEYELYGENYTTGSNGLAEITGLEWGYDYKAVETKAASGYSVPANCSGVCTILANTTDEQAVITIVNNQTSVGITKVDAVGGAEVAGATLTVAPKNAAEGFAFPENMFALADGKSVALTKNDDGSVSWLSAEAPVMLYGVPAGEYTLTETLAPAGYAQAASVDFTVAADGTVSSSALDADGNVRMTDERVNGSIVILKKNENGDVLENAKFIVWKLEGSDKKYVVADEEGKVTFTGEKASATEFKTGTDGKATVSDLPWGVTYYAAETAAPEGYRLADDVPEFALAADNSGLTKTVVDYADGVYVEKHDETGADLAGAQFRLEALDADGTLTGVTGVTVAADGRSASWTSTDSALRIHNMRAGSYRLTEISAPNGYTVAAAIDFTVDGHGKVFIGSSTTAADGNAVVVTDAPFSVMVSKKDLAGSEELAGATLKVTELDGTQVVAPFVTDGTVKALDYKFAAGKVYILTEESAPNGYTVAESIAFKADENGELYAVPLSALDTDNVDNTAWVKLTDGVVVMKDARANGSIVINKKDTSGAALADAKFIVWTVGNSETKYVAKDSEGRTVFAAEAYEFVTTADGTITIPDLPWGVTYFAQETVPPEGFRLSGETVEFALTKDTADLTLSKDIVNYANGVTISKQEIAGGAEVAGATLTVAPNGTAVSLDAVTAVTNGEAVALTKNDDGSISWISGTSPVVLCGVPAGSYTLTETTTPNGYITAEAIDFAVAADGTVTGTEVVDGVVVMKDARANGSIVINKKDTSGAALADAKFIVWTVGNSETKYVAKDSEGRTVFAAEAYEFVTTADGKITIPDLPWGVTYFAKETAAPENYRLNDATVEFALTKDTANLTLSRDVVNYKDGVTISKQEIAGGAEVAGATLTVAPNGAVGSLDAVTAVSNGEAVALTKNDDGSISWISGTAPVVLCNLPAGSYTLTETTAPNGYVTAEAIDFAVAADGTVTGTEIVDGAVVMKDARANGSIVINKKDENGAALANAKFIVWTVEGSETKYVAKDSEGKNVFAAEAYEFVTTADGKITVSDLPWGVTYFAKEIAAPEGYRLNDAAVEFALTKDTANLTLSKDVTNYANIVSVSKKDLSNDEELAGATLKVTDLDNAEIVAPFVSDGKVNKLDYRFITGKVYVLTEETAPEGYTVAESIAFKVDADGEVYAVPVSELKLADGVDSTVWNKMSDGTVVMKDAPVPKNIITYISKVELGAGNELPGAKLSVTDSTGKPVVSFTSGTEPTKFENKFTPGEVYTLTETTAPEGYEVAESMKFMLNADGKVLAVAEKDYKSDGTTAWGEPLANDTVVMKDAPVTMTISKRTVTGTELAGATLNVALLKSDVEGMDLGKVTGSIPMTCSAEKNSLTWESSIVENTLKMLPAGEYSLSETIAPAGFKVASTLYFKVDSKGNVLTASDYKSDGSTAWGEPMADDRVIMVDEAKPEENKPEEPAPEEPKNPGTNPVTGSFTFTKRDNFGRSLSGAQFRLKGNGVDMTATSDAGGAVSFSGLKPGSYTLTEAKAPDGYTVSTASITVVVSDSGAVAYKINGVEYGVGQIESTLTNTIKPTVVETAANKETKPGDTVDLKSQLISKKPELANLPLTWVSSNPSVVEVDQNGNARVLGAGEAKITASSGGYPVMTFVLGSSDSNGDVDGQTYHVTPNTGDTAAPYRTAAVVLLAVSVLTAAALLIGKRVRKTRSAK